jgi:adenylate kinase family enzyme
VIASYPGPRIWRGRRQGLTDPPSAKIFSLWDRRSERGQAVCRMRKVAVFGNAGGGKSTLARRLAEVTGLPLYPLDRITYKPGGEEIPHEEYLKIHTDLLSRDEWIIDGFGGVASAWERFSAADTLVYIDLPLFTHYGWVTKRLAKGLFVSPEGWPENSPMWSSTLSSYRVLWLCHRRLTPRYRQLVVDAAASKRVHHLKSPAEMRAFLQAVEREQQSV